jgi:hypothetical protein
LEVETRKLSYLRERAEGSGVRKLKEEVRELRGILKCSVCCDHQKEVISIILNSFPATSSTANILQTNI